MHESRNKRITSFSRSFACFAGKKIRPVFALLIFAFFAHAQTVTGIVTDSQNAPIAGATLRLKEHDKTIATTTTNERGTFTLASNNTPNLDLTVEAVGFAAFTLRLPNGLTEHVEIVLQPAEIRENVSVSIMRAETRLSETPASIVVLNREMLRLTAAQTLDDSLRQIAGFILFRRSSSKTSNPTTQGANLRGVSGSGASRAAVLFDGLSLNDAFGGWTYWSRVPQIAVEQTEVLRGGASSFYGTSGLSGAVNLTAARPEDAEPVFRVQTSAGSQETYDASLFTAANRGGWGFDLAAETFHTGGYVPAAEDERGSVDTNANSRHNNVILGLEKRFRSEPPAVAGRSAQQHDNARIFLRGNLFSERRDNGTSLTNNRTYFRQVAGGADLSNDLGRFELRLFVQTQVYDQTFSAVSADRNAETLSRLQRVPSQSAGGSLFWTRPFGDHSLSASFETREVRGFSDESGYFGGQPTSALGSGGRERTYSAFAQEIWRVSDKLNINFGGRFDHWQSFAAQSVTRVLATNTVTIVRFPDHSENAFSPWLAAIYRLNNNVSFYGSFSRSFRAPTLNELYRGFRVGNVVTLANEDLIAERANTFETGVNLSAFARRVDIRGNVFVTEVFDPIVSVTLTTTPTLITRQRQNVGKTRTRGLELDADFLLRDGLRLSTSYLLADSRVTRFPANTDLVGKFLPQIARQQISFQLYYSSRSRFSAGVQARVSDGQFEDDLNSLRLRPYFTMDTTAAFRVHKTLEVFAAIENVFNSRYDIGLTPNRTVAAPRFLRVGLRFDLGKR